MAMLTILNMISMIVLVNALPRRSVFIFRHCLRSTPTTVHGADGFNQFNNYTSNAFPGWPVPVYQCLPNGLGTVTSMGAQLKDSFPGDILMKVDTSCKRDNDTAVALLSGMNLPAYYEAAPELFSPTRHGLCPPLDSQTLKHELQKRFDLNPVSSSIVSLLLKLQDSILGHGQAPPLVDIPNKINNTSIRLTGGISVASDFSEAFLMQQGSGEPVAWGRASESDVYNLLAIHAFVRNITARVFKQVSRTHSKMASEIMDFLLSSEDTKTEKTLALIGHDTDLDAIGELFGLEWHSLPFPRNATTPGSALRLDIDEENKITTNILYQKFNSSTPIVESVPATYTWLDSVTNVVDFPRLNKWLYPRLDKTCM